MTNNLTWGLFVAATTTILSPEPVVIPSNWRRNSVLILLTPSCSPDLYWPIRGEYDGQ